MNNYLLLVVLPNMNTLLNVISVIGIISSVWICCVGCNEKNEKLVKKSIKIFIYSLVLIFISCFIPTKKEIIELKIISVVSGVKGIDKVPQNIIDKLNDFLEIGNK